MSKACANSEARQNAQSKGPIIPAGSLRRYINVALAHNLVARRTLTALSKVE
jgi:hypothetical protein